MPRDGRGETPSREGRGRSRLRLVIGTIGIALFAIVVGAIVLSFTPVLQVRSIEAASTAHIPSSDIIRLSQVDVGTPLISLDREAIRSRLMANPWVVSVDATWGIDGTLHIAVSERSPYALVVMGSQNIAWYLAEDGVWLEPSDVKPSGEVSMFEAALEKSRAEGLLLITDVPQTVNPEAGAKTTDASIEGVLAYQEGFSPEFAQQVAYYRAESESSLTCVLMSGVEISLGAPREIESKEVVIQALLAEFPNQLTYINVRVPSRPTYRKLDSENVAPGSGVYGEGDETFGDEGAPEEEEQGEDEGSYEDEG